MGRALGLAAAVSLAVLVWVPGAGATAPYTPIAPPLSTPWTRTVSTTAPLPEYPRPELQRQRWMNLNGRWQYEAAQPHQPPPFGRALAQTILVPFPVEAPLSGIGREDYSGWYRRTFVVPRGWRSDHVLLNFGAVSWLAAVWVNGHLAGKHRGDYDSFSFDITHLLHRTGTNELIVGFQDPVGGAGEPVGKQASGPPMGIHHSASSGIWQTVWLEPVAAAHITSLTVTPELGQRTAVVSAELRGPRGGRLLATALAGKRTVASGSVVAGKPLLLHIRKPILWTPWNPYLYQLHVELVRRDRVVDAVSSYFGMRSISLGRVGGAVRILLNGKFVFETGALDQGYWPDGLYTPPSDAAMRFDILAAKRLGYDMLREHEKVQPDRWYYWADRLGILVWQDMPSTSTDPARRPTKRTEAELERELTRIVLALRSHPSLVMWIPFNEGWGQFDPGVVTRQIKQLDPAALVDADSGSADCCAAVESQASDVRDSHLYTGPFAVPADHRASVIGEYGAMLPYPPAGHRWPGILTSLGVPAAEFEQPPVDNLLRVQYAELRQEMRTRGLSAAVFTELANYEQELGILTYDRRVFTIDPEFLNSLNQQLIDESESMEELERERPAVLPEASGLWQFTEGAGSVAADSSGHQNQLTLAGGASWVAGPVLAADATHAVAFTRQGQVARTAAPAIDLGGSFTVSAWLRSDLPGQSGSAISEAGPAGSAFSLGIRTAPGGGQSNAGLIALGEPPLEGEETWWSFDVAPGDCTILQCGMAANLHFADSRWDVVRGRWYQLTAVYDALTRTISLYVNGVAADVEHGYMPAQTPTPLVVGEGSGAYSGNDQFIGAVGRLRTYSSALTPPQVWEIYRADAGQVACMLARCKRAR